jgi:hypothetical protein
LNRSAKQPSQTRTYWIVRLNQKRAAIAPLNRSAKQPSQTRTYWIVRLNQKRAAIAPLNRSAKQPSQTRTSAEHTGLSDSIKKTPKFMKIQMYFHRIFMTFRGGLVDADNNHSAAIAHSIESPNSRVRSNPVNIRKTGVVFFCFVTRELLKF